MKLTPYLFLDGRAEDAITFYQTALGATIEMLMRFKENPDPQPGMSLADHAEKIMHAHLMIGANALMLSDGRCGGHPVFQGTALSLTVDTDAEAEHVFKALSDGGQIQMPMTSTFYASRFGMAADKFGVNWMVLTSAPAEKSGS